MSRANVLTKMGIWVIGLIIGAVAIVVGLMLRRWIRALRGYLRNIEQKRRQLEQLKGQICQLSLEEAQVRAKQALVSEEWILEVRPAKEPPAELVRVLPDTVRQLAAEYEAIYTTGGSKLFLGRPEPTSWNPSCYRIGWVDEDETAELVVCPPDDTVYELDWWTGSVEGVENPKVSRYPSIYHWIAYDFALLTEELQ